MQTLELLRSTAAVPTLPFQLRKGMSWDEATLNREEIKPAAVAFIELCLPEVIS